MAGVERRERGRERREGEREKTAPSHICISPPGWGSRPNKNVGAHKNFY